MNMFWNLCTAGYAGPPGPLGESISIPVKGQVGPPGQHGVIGFPGPRGEIIKSVILDENVYLVRFRFIHA